MIKQQKKIQDHKMKGILHVKGLGHVLLVPLLKLYTIPYGIRTDWQRPSQSIWGTFPAFYKPMGANGWGNNAEWKIADMV
jgi:hypothetical protein